MRLAHVSVAFFLGLLIAGSPALAQDAAPAKLWQEIEQILPRRGSLVPTNAPSAAIDWPGVIGKSEELMVRSGQTPVEPFAMYYLANFLFEAGRLDEAIALYETIKSQFPSHPLVSLKLAADQKPMVVQAIEDCAAELGWRAKHPRGPIAVPVLDPKVTATLHLSTGDVKIRFFKNAAPKHVENFIKLAEAGEYDGTRVGQIVQEAVINLGDPASKGPAPQPPPSPDPTKAGPSQPHEFANLSHQRGALAMSRHISGVDSSASQFQVVLKDQPYFDFTQTIFGRVVEGIEIVDAISRMPRDQFQRPGTEVVLKRITITRE